MNLKVLLIKETSLKVVMTNEIPIKQLKTHLSILKKLSKTKYKIREQLQLQKKPKIRNQRV
jgi:hypothetical protein